MRLPFFRSKNPADPRAQPARGVAGAGAEHNSVQAARTRSRRRLIGALVLLAAGVVGFPVLFETQPRPLAVDTPIFVPAATSTRVTAAPTVPPLTAVPPDAGNEPVAVAASAPQRPASVAAPAALPLAVATPKSLPATAQAAASGATPPKPQPPPADVSNAVKPEPELEPETSAATSGRFVVQVGAYNDPARLRAARQQVEKLGYKTYTQDVDSPTGKRTRVRVGPFASRQEADAVAAKVKASGMQANVLTL